MVQKWYSVEYELISSLIKQENHVRALATKLNKPHSTVLRKLHELSELGVVDYKIEGKNNVYFIKDNLIARRMVINSENYKLIKILTKHSWVSPLFKQILEECKCSLIILFGSYAKGLATENSDIDIFIETSDIKIKRHIEQLHHKLSVKIGKFNKDDLLIKEILKNHIIIRGIEEYYEKNRIS